MTVGTLFLFIACYMLYPPMPLFITGIGGTEADAGLAMGAFMITPVLLRPFVGGLLDRIRRRSFVIGGVLLFALAMSLYAWVGGGVMLVVLRVLHERSWAISTTALPTAVTEAIPVSRRGEGIGWFSMAMTVAMAVGPLLGLAVAQNLSYDALFWCATALSRAALGATLDASIPARSHGGARRIEIVEASVLPVTVAVFLLFVAYGGITTFVPLYAATLGVNAGLFFLAYAATRFVIRPVAGRLSVRHGETFVLVPALVVTAVALLTLSVSRGLRCHPRSDPVWHRLWFSDAGAPGDDDPPHLSRPHRRCHRLVFDGDRPGSGLGAIVLGWVSQERSCQAVFVVCAVSVGLSLLIVVLVVHRGVKHAADVSVSTDTLAGTREPTVVCAQWSFVRPRSARSSLVSRLRHPVALRCREDEVPLMASRVVDACVWTLFLPSTVSSPLRTTVQELWDRSATFRLPFMSNETTDYGDG